MTSWPRSSRLLVGPKPCAKAEGKPTDIGGYNRPSDAKTAAALRPSATFNGILA
jgi:isocitrate dehydrogenase